MIEFDRCDLAWAAGFYDGEGSSSAIINQGKLLISTSISQVNIEVLCKFQVTVNVGNITGPYKGRTINSRNRWIYTAYGFEKVQYIMCLLWNDLSTVKKNQFKKTIASYVEAIELGLNKSTEYDKRQRALRQLKQNRRMKQFAIEKNSIPFKSPFI